MAWFLPIGPVFYCPIHARSDSESESIHSSHQEPHGRSSYAATFLICEYPHLLFYFQFYHVDGIHHSIQMTENIGFKCDRNNKVCEDETSTMYPR